ncbi:MAG: putative OB-fold protein [Halioglobus sp.]
MNNALTPPSARTHLGLQMTAALGSNELQLQCCEDCTTVQYPPREVCSACLSDSLTWQAVDPAGSVMASTTLHHCLDPWFSERTPWLMGSIKLDCGPVVLAHLTADVHKATTPVWIVSIEDPSGQAVLVAVAQSLTPREAQARAQQLMSNNLQETT